MSYTLKSLRLISQSIDNVIPARWALSGTDTDATILAAGYISDAKALGVKVGDIVDYYYSTGPELYTHIVTVVASTGATLGSSPSTSS